MIPFFWRRKRSGDAGGVHWFWALTFDGAPSADFAWEDVRRGLEALRPDPDSFLVLERRNPRDARESGFLQCAVTLEGDHAGWYTVECGYPGPKGPVLLRREYSSIGEVIPVFEAVHRQRGVVFSGFSDLSAAMSGHNAR